jgi:plasmid stabilization system protein ParE
MSVRKADAFISDIERQFEWYALNADWEIADRYLDAVEASIELLGKHPQLGPHGGFKNQRLRDWRFFVVLRPFNKHILYYEIINDAVMLRRAMHGHRDLPRRLLEN